MVLSSSCWNHVNDFLLFCRCHPWVPTVCASLTEPGLSFSFVLETPGYGCQALGKAITRPVTLECHINSKNEKIVPNIALYILVLKGWLVWMHMQTKQPKFFLVIHLGSRWHHPQSSEEERKTESWVLQPGRRSIGWSILKFLVSFLQRLLSNGGQSVMLATMLAS